MQAAQCLPTARQLHRAIPMLRANHPLFLRDARSVTITPIAHIAQLVRLGTFNYGGANIGKHAEIWIKP
jgi:hypothetical protein